MAESYDWYEEQVNGLDKRFIAAVDKAIEDVQERPLRCPVIYRGIRQSLVKTFPFSICYLVHEAEVEVVAVFHASRDPNELRNRAS